MRAARRLVRTPLGDALARRLYPPAAKLGAEVLGRVDGVAAVYLGGSFRHLEAITPGYSDLDLMLFTHPFATDAAHVRFRDAVDVRLRALHLAFPAIQTVDYLDAASIPLVRACANDFGRTIDARFVHAFGAQLLDAVRHAAARDRTLEYVFAIRRWAKAASTLLEVDAFGDPFERLRSARRLFTDVASGYANTERLAPFAQTLAAVRAGTREPRHRAALDALVASTETNTHTHVPLLLAGTLAVLEAFADECTLSLDAPERPPAAASTPLEARLHADAVSLGAERAHIIASPARSRRAQGFITFDGAIDISQVIANAGAIVAHVRPYTRGAVHAVFLTPSLVRAAFALDPIPLTGSALAARMGDGVATPSRAVSRTLYVARVVSGLWRLPSIRFHVAPGRDQGRESAARELSLLFHLLDELDGQARSDEMSPLSLRDELDLVAALRGYAARVHATVPRALARRDKETP